MNGKLKINAQASLLGLKNITIVALIISAGGIASASPKLTASAVIDSPQTSSSIRANQALFDDEPTTETRTHRLDIRVFSLIPEKGPDSYRGTGGLACITGIGGMVGPAYSDDERQFGVQISPQLQRGILSAAVRLTPWPADAVIQERSFNVDLSSLDAKTVELGRAPDGRVYKLSLMPGMEITPPQTVKPISKAYKQVTNMRFSNSTVIINNDTYAGTIGEMWQERAYIDILGLLRVDFSLLQFSGSERMGILDNGLLRLKIPNGTTVEITNVLSLSGEIHPGGPYEVWAKWAPAKETPEEAVAKELALYEKEKLAGNPDINTPEVKRRLERLKKGAPLIRFGGQSGGNSQVE